MEEYKVIKERVTGNLDVFEDYQYNDLDADIVTVHPNVKARLFGVIRKALILKKNSKVFLHGQLIGKVIDEGGRFYHFDK